MVLSNWPQAGAACCGDMVSRMLSCLASMSACLKFARFGMPSTPTRLPSHWAGNHEPPVGQSEHQPLERTLIGDFGSVRSVRIVSEVEAIGVALKPPASRPLTISFFAATDRASSDANRNLISNSPGLKPAFFNSDRDFAASVTEPLLPRASYSLRPAVPGGRIAVPGTRVTPMISPPAFQAALYGYAQPIARRTLMSLILVMSRNHMYVQGEVPVTRRALSWAICRYDEALTLS